MVNLQKSQLGGTLLSELLEDKDDTFKAKILDLVARHGLDSDDPIFHVLIATDYLQVMLEEAPLSLEQEFKKQEELIAKATDLAVKQSILENQKTVRDSIQEILKKTDKIQAKNPKLLTNAVLAFLGIFLLGSANGVGMTLGLRQLQSSGVKVATKEEALDLAWAQSEEGRFARNLYEWNRAYIESGNCQQDMQSQGVSLQLGNQRITEGICALFVQPPPN